MKKTFLSIVLIFAITLGIGTVVNASNVNIYNENGDSEPAGTMSNVYNTPVDITVEVTKDGFNFVGWEDEEGTVNNPETADNIAIYVAILTLSILGISVIGKIRK